MYYYEKVIFEAFEAVYYFYFCYFYCLPDYVGSDWSICVIYILLYLYASLPIYNIYIDSHDSHYVDGYILWLKLDPIRSTRYFRFDQFNNVDLSTNI